jgi:predicted dienelactone hydrolase
MAGPFAVLFLWTCGAAPPARSSPARPVTCEAPFHLGFKVVTIPGGPKVGLWYPTDEPESRVQYSRDFASNLARGAPPATCRRFPLVIFSHGFGGCGTQSIFFTEELARHGYFVAAPDHMDATCSVDGKSTFRSLGSLEPFAHPETWNERTYLNRRNDLELVIQWLLKSAEFGMQIDPSAIGVAGHSLGGYTVLGLAGGWDSWKDQRIKAVIAFSPYVAPFLLRQRLPSIDVPIMYQGATFDFFITPSLAGDHGAYAVSRAPKYFVELQGGNHFEWTNLLCFGKRTVSDCLSSKSDTGLINGYAIAFLDAYLKGETRALKDLNGSNLAAYQHQ